MNFTMRHARPDDVTEMCDLLSELFSIEQDFKPDMEKQSAGLGLLLDNTLGPSVVFVAEKDNEIIGMCSVQTVISTSEGGAAGLLEDLIVRQDVRGKGIGSKLLSEVIKWCKTQGIQRIQLLRDIDNAKALDFYCSKGWDNTKLVCMRKLL
ncbi:MAG: GNAT family N-acetyltransferase [Nitrospirae bacterium]|nr:GNAT family N-acetyltransferase [Nitrospirota bacterium]